MTRTYRSVKADPALLRYLEQELEQHGHLLSPTPETLTRDHMLFIRSLSPAVSQIDPRYNGGDHSLAHLWYSAEDSDSDYTEFRTRLQLLRALLRFGYAKIADVGRGTGTDNPIRAAYTVSQVDEPILSRLRRELPRLTHIRDEETVTPEHCAEIMEFTPLIDAIDRKYAGVNCSELPHGLSLAERWYRAEFTDFEERRPASPEDFAEIFERFYTILYTLAHRGCAVTIHSTDGRLCYPDPIYPDQP